MIAIRDVLILSTVYALGALYALTVSIWIRGRARSDASMPASERLGISIILGILLLGVANNYLSVLIGARAAAAVLLLVPLTTIAVVARRHEGWSAVVRDRAPSVLRDAGAAVVCAAFLLITFSKLFLWNELVRLGTLYPDLPWHIGRAAQQAFQSTPGFWPLSPMAFPAKLPFEAFVADSLVSATFRYLPIELHAFNYPQVLFAWAMVLWTAVVLIAGSGPLRSFIVLTAALILAPMALWSFGLAGYIVFVLLHANPNTLVAFPIALAFTFHVTQAFRRGARPVPLFIAAVPAASFLFKPNQAFALGFLQAAGFVLWFASGDRRGIVKSAAGAAVAWAVAMLLTTTAGPWPVSPAIAGSSRNLWHYATVAIPALGGMESVPRLAGIAFMYLMTVGGIGAMAGLLRIDLEPAGPNAGRAMFVRDVAIPIAILAAAMAYLLFGWWLITPTGLAPGEPMHVNFELIAWLMIVPIANAVGGLADAAVRAGASGRGVTRTLAASFAALWLFMSWNLNTHDMQLGGLVIAPPNYDLMLEGKLRKALSSRIPDGHCFSYGRRYAIYVTGEFDPDAAIAATGCPVVNGKRWRGYLGANNQDEVRHLDRIDGVPGEPFQLVDMH